MAMHLTTEMKLRKTARAQITEIQKEIECRIWYFRVRVLGSGCQGWSWCSFSISYVNLNKFLDFSIP
jgi:Fe-S cluster assembly iron-binding protein IscA